MKDAAGKDRHAQDLVAAYVLGAVTSTERALVESHLALCADCRRLEAGLREVEALLPALAPELEPPPTLKTRLMDIVRAEARGMPAASGAPQSPPPEPYPLDAISRREPALLTPIPRPMSPRRWTGMRRGAALLALAAAVVLVVAGVSLWRLLGGAQPVPTTQVAISGTAQPAIQGSLRYFAPGGRVDLDLRGLKPVPPGQVYELWLIRGHYRLTKRVGAFRPARDGTVHIEMGSDNVSNYTLTCLTVERAPGASRPTLPLVAVGEITG